MITIYCWSKKINVNVIYRHQAAVEEQHLCKTILVQETLKQKCKLRIMHQESSSLRKKNLEFDMLSLFKNCNFYQYYAYRKDVMGENFYKMLTNIRGLFVGLLIASNALNIGALWIKFESFLKIIPNTITVLKLYSQKFVTL